LKPRNTDSKPFSESKVKGLAVEVWNNDINKALRKFKKKVQDDGILQELRDREHYVKPSAKRAKAKAAGIARWKKKQSKDGINETRLY
jgi:small subunit ribosomal protein S21